MGQACAGEPPWSLPAHACPMAISYISTTGKNLATGPKTS